jgi:hypothetical protein
MKHAVASMRWFSIETRSLPCDKSGRSMMRSPTASLFATYKADFRCIELFNMTFFIQIGPPRPISQALRTVLERVADELK